MGGFGPVPTGVINACIGIVCHQGMFSFPFISHHPRYPLFRIAIALFFASILKNTFPTNSFILKTHEQRLAEKALLDKSPLKTLTLEDFLESERHKLTGKLTPVTPETFAVWKRERMDKKAAEEEAHRAKEATGRAMFEKGGWEGSESEDESEKEDGDDDRINDDDDEDDDDAGWDMETMRRETERIRAENEQARIAAGGGGEEGEPSERRRSGDDGYRHDDDDQRAGAETNGVGGDLTFGKIGWFD